MESTVSSLLIPGAAPGLHASKDVQAEAPLWTLMAEEAVPQALGRLPAGLPCSSQQGSAQQPQDNSYPLQCAAALLSSLLLVGNEREGAH